jgi:RNA polymerase sigma factor (sigma-70 family)
MAGGGLFTVARKIAVILRAGSIYGDVNTLSEQSLRVSGDWRTLAEHCDPDEATLLRAARSGDAAATERLLSAYERPLYVLCRGMLRHAEDAEDAAQETFLRVLRGLAQYRGDSSLRTWLFRIAVNVCLERKRGARPVASTEELHPDTLHAPHCLESGTVERLHALEALQTLHPRQRAILILKEVEGWTAAEIGRTLRCNERRVYHDLQLAHRALAAWRERHGI